MSVWLFCPSWQLMVIGTSSVHGCRGKTGRDLCSDLVLPGAGAGALACQQQQCDSDHLLTAVGQPQTSTHACKRDIFAGGPQRQHGSLDGSCRPNTNAFCCFTKGNPQPRLHWAAAHTPTHPTRGHAHLRTHTHHCRAAGGASRAARTGPGQQHDARSFPHSGPGGAPRVALRGLSPRCGVGDAQPRDRLYACGRGVERRRHRPGRQVLTGSTAGPLRPPGIGRVATPCHCKQAVCAP